MNRRTPILVVLAVFAVALAARTIPLYWSPLPSTLDGVGYAATARDAIAFGRFPFPDMRADNVVFVGLLGAAGLVAGEPPLTLAQPLIALVGAASCLVGVALARRFALDLGWARRRRTAATLVAGVALSTSGIYLRRTSVPDEEALAFLLVPLLAIGLARFLATERLAWGVPVVCLLLVFPLTHTFSTLIAALTVTALLALLLVGTTSRRSTLLGFGLVGGFWVYFTLYYEFAARTALTVPYVGRVTAHPGLFLAWTAVLVVGVLWFRSASARLQRLAVGVPILAWFVVLLANHLTTVFPGTVPSPPLVTALALFYVLPVLAASWAAPELSADGTTSAILLALLAAPVTHVGFSLTAALTPEFFGTVTRTQTFAHLPVFVLVAATVGSLVTRSSVSRTFVRSRTARFALVALVLASVVATAPLAFMTLDTAAVPSTVTREEFAAVTFASTALDEPWASDHKRTRIASHYYRSEGSVGPVASWLRGGAAPACPTLVTADWTTTGAHFFPAAPETLERDAYERWYAANDVVYATTGPKEARLTRSRRTASGVC